ncbi:iron chaperone [Portibacter marinus]|uniref:iron chaperone n=1 Tax=Portibacter marinus TaxID=2898660 RepID=UPI001F3454EF|nr:DUF1801 domain-containing protein [Portibacter marinus]
MKKYQSVEEYLADHSGRHLEIMQQIVDLILEEVPSARPAISYGMPAYKEEKVIAGFYAYQNHVSYYPHSGAIIEKFKVDLKGYQTGKGTLQIGIQQDVPHHVIREMIREKVKLNSD